MGASAKSFDHEFSALAGRIRDLKRDELGLTDVLSLAELMIGSMQTFFVQLDTSIYKELRDISDFINKARKEIGHLQPANLKSEHIPLAGRELDEVVKATEQATNTIMEQAELIMGADTSDADAYQTLVNDAVMQIIEACSFQDITGQRISKVVETLVQIEDRISSLATALGQSGLETAVQETAEQKRRRELLLNGPSFTGEGVNQDEVDAMLRGEAVPEKKPAKAAPKSVAKPASKPAAKKPAAKAPESSSGGESTSQADIDALFD